MLNADVVKAEPTGYLVNGRLLSPDDILNSEYLNPERMSELKAQFLTAEPFPHIVMDNLFTETFLELISDEWPSSQPSAWQKNYKKHEAFYRSTGTENLGFITNIYFYTTNSDVFTNFLTHITGVEDIIVDQTLRGGGLHETRKDGLFGIHRDFETQERTMLTNAMIMITYLNRDWKSEYEGALELWKDGKPVKIVWPEFGRTIIFRHGPNSFHGLPRPLQTPEGVTRRALANYYYHNPDAAAQRQERRETLHIEDKQAVFTRNNFRRAVKQITPPIIWNAVKGRMKTP